MKNKRRSWSKDGEEYLWYSKNAVSGLKYMEINLESEEKNWSSFLWKRIIINLFGVQLSEIQFQVGLQSEESQEQDTQTGHVHIGKYL